MKKMAKEAQTSAMNIRRICQDDDISLKALKKKKAFLGPHN